MISATRYCPKCRAIIADPGSGSISAYALFWRDNRCTVCGTTLQPVESPNNNASQPDSDEELRQKFRRLRSDRLLLAAKSFHKRRLNSLDNPEADESSIDLSDIDGMTGTEFEMFIAEFYSDADRSVKMTKVSGDQGGDLIVDDGQNRLVVQVKRSISMVSNTAIQEVVAAKAVYRCNLASVVTNAVFTESAIQLAKANDVALIDRSRLGSLLSSKRIPALGVQKSR